jgi:hypothetical protein
MTTIYDIKKRAQQLSEKTDSETISPQEVGGLFSDLADYANDVDVNGSSLGIRKTYTSVSAMEADKNPVGDDGKPLKKGQLVNIYNQDDPSSADNNKVFSWQNPGWQIRTTLDAGYATREELTELEEKNKFGFLLCQAEPNSARGEIAYEGTFETGLYKKDYSFDTTIPWIKTTTVITTDSSLDNYFIKANFASINEGFYNLVILNEDETIKFGLIITGRKVVRLPKNTKFRISIRTYEVEPIFLNIKPSNIDLFELQENINNLKQHTSENSNNIEKLQEQVITIEEIKTELSKSDNYKEGQGYMSKPSSLEFGSFGKHGIYSNIPENTIIRVEVTSSIGSAYYYHLTDENDNILESVHAIGSVDVPEDFSHTFNTYNKVTKLYISIQGQQTVVSKIETKSYSIKDKLSNLEVEIDNLKNNIGNTYLSGLNVGIDGDSTTSEGSEGLGKSWPFYTNKVINFKSLKNIGMGNATLLDRTSNTSGTTYYPQWAPDVNEGWIDYWGLNDPNFAGDTGGKYESGTPEFDQATANNCLYGHIGYYISLVNKGKVPTPDIFILANAGVNDTWNFAQNNDKINTVLGTFDEAIAGNLGDIQRNTILKSIRWGIQKLRSEYPKCKIFFKTSVQQANRTHYGYYLTYEPIIKLLKYLSVSIIDSYSELGVQSDFEESEVASENHYTSDGTHPKSETYEIEGKFVASKLKTFFL